METKPLQKEFNSRGFSHKEVWREGDIAIYSRTRGSASHFETIKIKSHKGYTIGGVYVEPAECYPGAEAWGTLGFTFREYEDARAKAQQLLN